MSGTNPTYATLEAWAAAGRRVADGHSKHQFVIGEWMAAGLAAFPEKSAYNEAQRVTGLSRGHLRNIASTYSRTLSLRSDTALPSAGLHWNHYVALAPLEPEEQREWFNRAVAEKISTRALAKAVKKPPAPPAELPRGTYRVVYADPPWQYGRALPPGCAIERHYPTMPTDAICAMELPRIAKNAVLFLWVTSPFLPEGLRVMESWKFQYKASFVWDKVLPTFGYFNSGRHELLLIGTRGSFTPARTGTLFPSIQTFRRGEHSAKPPEFRDIIAKMYPHGQRVELFARGTLPVGWDGYGNEFEGNEPEALEQAA